ncbi:haloacid dehalogenase type II [Nguyenibacter vanlangensis]|uniref:Haloacid dehalogenase type II n=1 Tax=Nguyenibacter vanlangensis TaxID=1216886 RepID=A0A7Y7IVU6_9PROT|nr:haloacid dehalogenase type II [Nguyenibacter vanlangensis]NVN11294.1 haloacid dehalogenase type II [Nguyenibacter vanlangensis]
MSVFRPKYITFDCYGTLTRFRMSDLARTLFADQIPEEGMTRFCADFAGYRLDEVLGAWKPYRYVVMNAVERTCRRWGIRFDADVANRFYDAVPTWGPWPDVTEPLKRIAREIPLVILSNADNRQIHDNVRLLGAPFHRVYTAEDAQAYKPRMRAFEYMFDQLGCGPQDVLHVSSSLRYDLMTARDLGITHKVFVARGHEPSTPAYGYTEITDIGGLPAVVGL